MNRLFCFGLGYTARHLARGLVAAGWEIAGTVRAAGVEPALSLAGIASYPFTRGRRLADPASALAGTTHLLISVPPDAAGDPVLDEHAADVTALPALRWVGYLSTTAVYGDRGGDWVDEEAELRPTGERGRRRVAAEVGWLALHRCRAVPVHVFRLAGIYGPGRSALDTVRAGSAQRIDKPGQVFSRIHVSDLAAALHLSMARPDPGRIYNLCDDDPAPAAEVVACACALLGVPPPPKVPFAAAQLSPMARSFYDDNKRVSNRRIKAELALRLRYPSFREGLAALLSEEGAGQPEGAQDGA